MKEKKILIAALLAFVLQAHASDEARGHERNKMFRKTGEETKIKKQAEAKVQKDSQKKMQQKDNKKKLDQKVQQKQMSSNKMSLKEQHDMHRMQRQQQVMPVDPKKAKAKTAAQRKADMQKDKKVAKQDADASLSRRKSQKAKAIDSKLDRKSKQIEHLNQTIAELEEQDEEHRNAARALGTNSDLEDAKDKKELLQKEMEKDQALLATLTPQYEQAQLKKNKDLLQYYCAMDKGYNSKLETLRDAKKQFQDQDHALMVQDRKALDELKSKDNREQYEALLREKRKLNKVLSAKDKAAFERLQIEMNLKNLSREQIEKDLKNVNAELAKWGAKNRQNEVDHNTIASKLDADKLSKIHADEQFEKEVREHKSARLYTQEKADIDAKADELGMERMAPKRYHS